MDATRVVEALEQYVLEAGERIEEQYRRDDSLVLYTEGFRYEARPAGWRVAGEPWVGDAVRTVADGGGKNFVYTYGLLFPASGTPLFLNDVATMRELGRRLGDGLEPLAYAELLAELYSGRGIDGPTVLAAAATEFFPAGELVRDVDAVVAEWPVIDPSMVFPPVARREGGSVTVEFCSVHYYFVTEISAAVDVLQWTVVGGGGKPASWSRRYVAQRLERAHRAGG